MCFATPTPPPAPPPQKIVSPLQAAELSRQREKKDAAQRKGFLSTILGDQSSKQSSPASTIRKTLLGA